MKNSKNGKLPSELKEEAILIPPEIEKLGSEAIQIYHKALAEGEEMIPYCKMLVLGEGEAGKTSFLRQVVRKPYMKDIERTRGIVNQTLDTVEQSSLDISSDKWQVKDDFETNEQFASALAGHLMPELSRCYSKSTGSVSEEDLRAQLETIKKDLQSVEKSANKDADTVSTSPVQMAPQTQEEENVDAADGIDSLETDLEDQEMVGSEDEESFGSTEDLNDSFAMLDLGETQKLDKIVSQKLPFRKKEPSVVLNALDFAGQDMYRPMHHCFISKRAVYTVVFRLPDMRDYIKGKTKHNPLVDVSFWVRSIHAHICLQEDKEEMLACVLLVGTRRDELPDKTADLKEIDDFIEKSLMMDVSKPYINYIYSKANSSGCTYFVPVENSIDITKGESYLERSGTKLVQDTIISMSKKMPFLRESHPIKWLKFEERLKHRRSERKMCPIMKVSEVKELATQCGITDPQQQDLALQFFHDTGKVSWLKFLPHLFLDKDEDYEELSDLIILDPAWLMTAMKVVVELGSKNAENPGAEALSNAQMLTFKKDSIADFDIFDASWKLSVESLPESFITVRHLCLIFQAYCLIYPLQLEGKSAENPTKGQKFIVPCKLPLTIKDDHVYKLAECFATFYFDFYDFLPDEVYHRLICLALKNSETEKGQEIGNSLSKRSCFFVNMKKTNWLIEHEYQRLKIMVCLTKGSVLTDYITFIHLNFLSKICAESGFKGLAYCGGPEVTCKVVNKRTVLACVKYNKEEDYSHEPDLQPACRHCKRPEHEPVNKLEQPFSSSTPATCSTKTAVKVTKDKALKRNVSLNLRFLELFKWKDENGDKQQLRIIETISSKWRKVAAYLGLSVGQMDGIQQQSFMDTEQCCMRIFDGWIISNGESTDYPITWSGLHELLEDIGHDAIAEVMKSALETVGIEISSD